MAALAWGLLIARQSAGSGRFWQAALALHVVRSGTDGHAPSTEYSEVSDFVERAFRQAPSAPAHRADWHEAPEGEVEVTPVLGSVMLAPIPMPWDPQFPYTQDQLDELNKVPVYDRRGKLRLATPFWSNPVKKKRTQKGSIDFTPRCCVKRFDYPTFYCNTAFRASDGSTSLSVLFESEAEFTQGMTGTAQGDSDGNPPPVTEGDGQEAVVNCACKCCEFRQFIDADQSRPEGSRSTSDRYVEDCSYDDETDLRTPRAVPWDGPPRVPTHPVDCYGDREANHKNSVYHHGDKSTPGDRSTACHYWMRDLPSFLVDPISPGAGRYSFSATFLGRIVDVCHDERPVITKAFTVEWSFALGSSADTMAKQRAAAGEANVKQVTADKQPTAAQPPKKTDGECA